MGGGGEGVDWWRVMDYSEGGRRGYAASPGWMVGVDWWSGTRRGWREEFLDQPELPGFEWRKVV